MKKARYSGFGSCIIFANMEEDKSDLNRTFDSAFHLLLGQEGGNGAIAPVFTSEPNLLFYESLCDKVWGQKILAVISKFDQSHASIILKDELDNEILRTRILPFDDRGLKQLLNLTVQRESLTFYLLLKWKNQRGDDDMTEFSKDINLSGFQVVDTES